jgi:hypothetical protein
MHTQKDADQLVYVEGEYRFGVCYFAPRQSGVTDLGDDWNDTPWFTNASPPYRPSAIVVWYCPHAEVARPFLSVNDMNRQRHPWILFEDGNSINAGDSLSDVLAILKRRGALVATKHNPTE